MGPYRSGFHTCSHTVVAIIRLSSRSTRSPRPNMCQKGSVPPAEEFQNQLAYRENCWPNSSTVMAYFQMTSLTPLLVASDGAAFAAAHLEADSMRQSPHHHRRFNLSVLHIIVHSNEYAVYSTPYDVLKSIQTYEGLTTDGPTWFYSTCS